MGFRETFLAAGEVMPFEHVHTAAGGARVYAMTVGEKDAFERAHVKGKGRRFRARLVIATARDDEGRPLFEAEDLERLDGLPAPLLEPLVEAAVRVNGLSGQEQEALEKN